MKIHRLALAVLLAASTAACGSESAPTNDNGSGTSKRDRAKQTVQRLFALANATDYAAAAPLIVYRGDDKARNWKDVCDYENESDRRRVEQVVQRIKRYSFKGTPTFKSFESEKENEGEWLVWKVETEAGEAVFACLDIGGTVALGDID